MTIAPLLRPDIAALEPYTPIVPLDVLAARLGLPIEQLVKLDANENPYGPSPQVGAALGAFPHFAIYPDPDHTALRAALSGYTGLPAANIICGAGSDELIDLLMRATLSPGDAIIDCPPTFGMYSFCAGVNAARTVNVPRRADHHVDVDAVERAVELSGAKLLFLAAPNNPTGTPLPRTDLLRLLDLPLIVVADEAYFEFCGQTVADLVPSYPNLMVLRTFSKWAGLAGLRVGYALAQGELLAHLWKIKQPYNVNAAADVAALAALADAGYRERCVSAILSERTRLTQRLGALPGLNVIPSSANFLLCRVASAEPGRAAAEERALGLKNNLAARGILIRYFNKPGLRDCIRVSVGTPAQNDALLAALAELLA